MQSQSVELIAIFGDDITPAEAAWYSTAKEVTAARLARVPALLEQLALGDPPEHLPHCYDSETEVFTADGWQRWENVTTQTRLAAVTADFCITYETPSVLISQPYRGRMYGSLSQQVDFLVTPNHRMFVSRRTYYGYKPYEILTPDKIKDKCYRVSACAIDKSGAEGSYDEGWLYGFFLGDGHRCSSKKIQFRLKKQRKIEALLDNLNALGVQHATRVTSNGVTEITITNNDPLLCGKLRSKTIDNAAFAMSLNYRQGVFDGLMASDAHNKRGANSFVFSNTSYDLVIALDRLCATIGRYSKLKPADSNGVYKVHILARCVEPVVNKIQSKESTDFWREDYEGMIYCAAVSTGLLLVRRNGCIMVSGNSVPFEHTLISFRITSEIATHIHVLKHRIGVSVSSQSQRYMELRRDEYYIPDDWPDAVKSKAHKLISDAFYLYHELIDDLEGAGVDRKRAKESARFVLPYATQIRYRVTFNFLSFVHFQKLRNSPHAQKEIQLIADEMLRLVRDSGRFPNSLAAWGLAPTEPPQADNPPALPNKADDILQPPPLRREPDGDVIWAS